MQNKNHLPTWVVVADNCKARIYRLISFPKVEEILYMEHPDSRLHNQDLASKKPGHNSQRMGGTGYSYQSKTTPKDVEAAKFATFLSHFLSTEEQKKEFGHLYIIAEPSFLGLLRQHINPEIKKLILSEIAKELTSSDATEVEIQLSKI